MQFPGDAVYLLVVEDSEVDFELLVSQLTEAGVPARCTRVDTGPQLHQWLTSSQRWDALISKYSLPGFSGLEALQIHRELGGLFPFLFHSDSVGEQAAVECMRAGAQDFVLKGHPRLVPALLRELEQSQARATLHGYRQIVESCPFGIFRADAQGNVTFANARAGEILQTPLEALLERPLRDAFCNPRGEDAGQALCPPYRETVLFFLALGEGISLTLRPLPDGGVLVLVTDLSRERSLEQRRILSQKMEALGRLASGVAHDFNNTLTVILGFSGLLREELKDPDPLELLGLVEEAAQRGASLTRQILAVARQQALNLETIPLRKHLTMIQPLLQQAAGPQVELEIRFEAETDRVLFDPDQLLQVLVNLIHNARQAMEQVDELPIDGSRIQVICSDVVLDEGQAGLIDALMAAGHYVTLAVSDNGVGMSEETQQRVFEPYYTTKSEGSGLDLASLYGTVAQSGGAITVESENPHGTTFKIYLPCAVPPPAVPDNVPKPPGECVLLVVDDCEATRNLMREVLQRDGYQVLEAGSAREAMQRAETQKVDLLLSDVVLPDQIGPELALVLHDQIPGLQVIFTSGYGAEFCRLPPPERLSHRFVEKPFQSEDLLRKVRQALASKFR